MFEPRHQRILPRHKFALRLLKSLSLATTVAAFALSIGVAGYHWIANFGWIDSILNASMVLTGMGQVDRLISPEAKLFASVYAMFSGLVFVLLIGVLLLPVVHRILHKFHYEVEDNDEK